MLTYLARVPDIRKVDTWLPNILNTGQICIAKLRTRQLSFEDLPMSQALSKESKEIENYTLGKMAIHAWDLPNKPCWD